MKGRLLIIDSEAFDREIMAKIFSDQYTLEYAKHPRLSYSMCREFLPDVVYFELRTEELPLLQTVCESVTSYNPGTPLIIAVSYNSLKLERYAREQQVFYYLIRPFNLKELWDSLESAFTYLKKSEN